MVHIPSFLEFLSNDHDLSVLLCPRQWDHFVLWFSDQGVTDLVDSQTLSAVPAPEVLVEDGEVLISCGHVFRVSASFSPASWGSCKWVCCSWMDDQYDPVQHLIKQLEWHSHKGVLIY